MIQLRSAIRTIHADRDWWKKVLIGGALWITLLGWPLVEGHQLESIENSQRGFPTPLPPWHAWGNKAVVGIFAMVIDFFFFLFPMLLGGVLLLCGTLAAGITAGGSAVRPVALVVLLPLAGYLLVVWLLGVSAVAKQRYVEDGDLETILSFRLIREQMEPAARGPYLRARLLSIPAYALALAVLVLSVPVAGISVLAMLVVVWLAFSLLTYARLLAIQLYLAATQQVASRKWEMRTRRAET